VNLRYLAEFVLFSFIGVALSSLGAPEARAAADLEVGERAGESIGRLAESLRDFRLTPLAADLQVEARTMVFDFRQGRLEYEGAVRIRHGDVRMNSDQLMVTFEPENPSELQRIEASGNVQVLHETETATGHLAVYDPARATITLTGNAQLGSGPNTVKGEKVIVFLDEGRAVVEGGPSGPVRAHIEPKSREIDRLMDGEKRD
jgi:lipopolysaccharide transport protein LptA